jgi:hypothetical protein
MGNCYWANSHQAAHLTCTRDLAHFHAVAPTLWSHRPAARCILSLPVSMACGPLGRISSYLRSLASMTGGPYGSDLFSARWVTYRRGPRGRRIPSLKQTHLWSPTCGAVRHSSLQAQTIRRPPLPLARATPPKIHAHFSGAVTTAVPSINSWSQDSPHPSVSHNCAVMPCVESKIAAARLFHRRRCRTAPVFAAVPWCEPSVNR